MVIRGPEPADEVAIARFFAALVTAGDSQTFLSHSFTAREAYHLARRFCPEGQPTEDVYRFGFARGEAVAYGMLRGGDEGFAEPSIGIAVHPDFRGRGLARQMITQLHDLARLRGAKLVRLKVYRDNTAAVGLYQKLGYILTPHDEAQWLGRLSLTAGATPNLANSLPQKAA
jgi:ribosomal-protein-alanine N-acetyltransferase